MVKFSENISSLPSFRPLVLVTGGILLSNQLNFTPSQLQLIFILSGLLVLFLLLPGFRKSARADRLSDILLMTGLFFSGILLTKIHHKETDFPGEGYFLVQVASLPAQKASSTYLKLKMIYQVRNRKSQMRDYFINAYFEKSSEKDIPEYGKILLIKTDLGEIKNSGNPGEFDYSKYLERKKIYSSCYLTDSCWIKTSVKYQIPVLEKFAIQIKKAIQEKIRSTAEKYGKTGDRIMLAICTGDKSEVDRTTKNEFSEAGAIHIMAVSGLHVGLIWLFLYNLSFFLGRTRAGRFLQVILIIIVLWLFALMTGLSASVIRSCTMFTLASLAKLMNRNSSVFNSVFVAALLQVIINPDIIFDAGFQFSYSAVISILLFHPVFRKILTSRYNIFQKPLDLVNVSLSAQVLTFPLTALLFGRFPVYFLLTNLCVIPLVTLLMILFISSILLSFSTILMEIFLRAALEVTDIMEFCIIRINKFPFHLVENIHFSPAQALIFILLSLFLLNFIYYRSFKTLYISLILVLLLISTGIGNFKIHNRNSLCVFNIRGLSAVDININRKHYFITGDTTGNLNDILYNASAYWKDNYALFPDFITGGEGECQPEGLFNLPGEGNYLFQASTSRFAIIQDSRSLINYRSSERLKTDALILGGNLSANIENLLKYFETEQVILDSSVPWFSIRSRSPDSLILRSHKISEGGAFVVEF